MILAQNNLWYNLRYHWAHNAQTKEWFKNLIFTWPNLLLNCNCKRVDGRETLSQRMWRDNNTMAYLRWTLVFLAVVFYNLKLSLLLEERMSGSKPHYIAVDVSNHLTFLLLCALWIPITLGIRTVWFVLAGVLCSFSVGDISEAR